MAEILNVDMPRRLADVVQLLKEQGANPNRCSGRTIGAADDAPLVGAFR